MPGVPSGERKNWRLNKQLIMLLRTSQMLKKSGINSVCAEKETALRSRDAFGGKEEPALIVVSFALW